LAAEPPVEGTDSAKKQGRLPIGLEGVPECGDPQSWDIADELKLSLVLHWSSWDGSVPYSYSWTASPDRDQFKRYLLELKRRGYKVAIADTTVHMDQKHLPTYLDGKRFNDPVLLDCWVRYLEQLLAQYGEEIDFLSIGNEVDIYFGNKPDEWNDYVEFFKRGSEIVHRLRPAIKVGVILKPEERSLAKYWKDVEPFCDYLAVTYYTPNSMFEESPTAQGLEPDNPRYFAKELDRAIRFAGEKPVLITEIGSATDPAIDSSPELQARFVKLLFQWLPGKEEKLLGVLWLTAQDWPREGIRKALEGHLDAQLLGHEPFMRFLCSLGLRYEDGTKKPGYDVFKTEVLRYNERE
jgi:hypothetical protein